MKNNGFTFRRRIAGFKYAFQGLKRLFTHEANSWIHAFAAVCVVVAGFLFRIAAWEWVAVVAAIGFVLAAEAFNSAIERLGDAITEQPNNYIKHAKDLAAAAVLIAAITAAVIGLLVFLPKLIDCIS
ncbi:diacylglycerol kinase (ATP) [Parabacteroides sp. PFB2-10]|uniref:diacylglycerol kinase n=1 Tax=Parabacteroides sp. PFB2-10 TaxID=1742405 RepID=UPI0024764748|nr:diacylglycerol kinase family protein [Parabacteroides sp. PFB2-10]MDH6313297.1 diacylglycerol kinase (ATP) [Parabacteroides sp. PFB2-10]MDL2245779.1 diacylglycerol kinase family protein [Parabacteroides sp. OttesenSCG-928-J18]